MSGSTPTTLDAAVVLLGKTEILILRNRHKLAIGEARSITVSESARSSRAGKVITTVQLPRGAVPAFLAVGGLFDADWRLAVACRNGRIHTIKVRTLLGCMRCNVSAPRMHDALDGNNEARQL